MTTNRYLDFPSTLVRALALLMLVSAAWLAMVQPASAHFDSGKYSHSGCPIVAAPFPYGTQKDPIGIVFYNDGRTGPSINHINFHAGWGPAQASGQYFVDHGDCLGTHGQRASVDCGDCTRYHIRLHQIQHSTEYNMTTVGTPHYEIGCGGWSGGHGIPVLSEGWSGFDQGRRYLRDRINSEDHYNDVVNWGNTNLMGQCGDQWRAGGNGSVWWIHIPYYTH